MLDTSHPAPIWLIWRELSLLEQLSFVSLCFLAVYSLCLVVAVVRYRNTAAVQDVFTRIRKRVKNLQQATVAAFYFFGFVVFAGFQNAYATIGSSKTPVGFMVLINFQVQFAFACNAFFALLLLHIVQCFLENRVDAFSQRSTSSSRSGL